jgi:hypothetical protein
MPSFLHLAGQGAPGSCIQVADIPRDIEGIALAGQHIGVPWLGRDPESLGSLRPAGKAFRLSLEILRRMVDKST